MSCVHTSWVRSDFGAHRVILRIASAWAGVGENPYQLWRSCNNPKAWPSSWPRQSSLTEHVKKPELPLQNDTNWTSGSGEHVAAVVSSRGPLRDAADVHQPMSFGLGIGGRLEDGFPEHVGRGSRGLLVEHIGCSVGDVPVLIVHDDAVVVVLDESHLPEDVPGQLFQVGHVDRCRPVDDAGVHEHDDERLLLAQFSIRCILGDAAETADRDFRHARVIHRVVPGPQLHVAQSGDPSRALDPCHAHFIGSPLAAGLQDAASFHMTAVCEVVVLESGGEICGTGGRNRASVWVSAFDHCIGHRKSRWSWELVIRSRGG